MKTLICVVVVVIVGVITGVASTKYETGGLPDRFDLYRTDDFEDHTEYLAKSEEFGDEVAKLTSTGVPKLTIQDSELYNFGAMNRHEIKRHTFVIGNEGEGMLEIWLLDTSCRCTLSKVKKRLIPPGETSEVEMEWMTNDYSDTFSQHATLGTNDPTRPKFDLRIRGKVISDVKASPAELVVSRIPVDHPVSVSTYVYSYYNDDMEITGHHFSNLEIESHFEVSIEKVPSDSQIVKDEVGAVSAHEVTISVSPGMPIGSINQTLLLSVNVPGLPDIELPVRGIIEGDITPRGNHKHKYDTRTNQVYLGVVAKGESLTSTMTLTVKGEFKEKIEFTIEKDGIDPADSLQAEIGPPTKLEKAWIFPLTITVPEDALPVDRLDVDPDKNGKIIIKTNHPSAPAIVLYFRFSVEG